MPKLSCRLYMVVYLCIVMMPLNFPRYAFRFKSTEKKVHIFDEIRKRFFVLTPEEWVRQNIIHHLVNDHKYPRSLIKIESSLKYNKLSKRSDIIVYDKKMNVFLLVECKSFKININRNAFKQISVYNKVYKSNNIMITNGLTHYLCEYNWNDNSFKWLDNIPLYPSN